MRSNLSVSRIVVATALMLTAAACSEHAREETKEAGDAIAADARAGADKAAAQSRETGREIADSAKEVANTAADKTKEAAREVADTTKRGAETVAEAGSDAWVTTKVKAKLLDESTLKGSAIDVDTSNHIVTLKGNVPSAAGKTRAESIAIGTEGVTRVVNQLVVKPNAGC